MLIYGDMEVSGRACVNGLNVGVRSKMVCVWAKCRSGE